MTFYIPNSVPGEDGKKPDYGKGKPGYEPYIVMTTKAKHGEAITLPDISGLTPEGRAIMWDPEIPEFATRDMEFWGEWVSAVTHTVTLKIVGPEGFPGHPDVIKTIPEGEEYYVYAPNIPGYEPDKSVVSDVMGTADVEETITYSVKLYRITLIVNYPEASMPDGWTSGKGTFWKEFLYDSDVTIPTFVRENFVLSWNKAIPEKMPDEDLEFTAVWQEVHCVIIDYTGPVEIVSQLPQINDKYEVGEKYTYQFYDIEGYAPDAYKISGTMGKADATYTIVYSKKVLIVTFSSTDGSYVPQATVSYGEKVERPADPTRPDHTFSGWFLNGVAYDFDTPVTDNITLEARWSIELVTITFDANGHGTAPLAMKIEKGTGILQLANLSESGFLFGGWYTDRDCTTPYVIGTAVDADITLYAKWTVVHTVTFEANGHGTAPEAQKIEHGQVVSEPPMAAEGYSFGGWYTDAGCTSAFDFSQTIMADVTLYAKWSESRTVSFDANGHGNAPAAVTVALGSKATKPADPTAEGYTFGGWFKDAGCSEAFVFETEVIDDNITLYAKWTINSYTVTFNIKGHGTAPGTQTVEYGSKASKPADLSAEGYTFGGWFSDSGCTTAFDFTKGITSDTTVYAKWIAKPSVTPGGSGGGSSSGGTTTPSAPTTTTDPDGTKTTTEKGKDGSVTETVEKPDGSTKVTKTDKEGKKTETVKNADGSSSERVTDKDGSFTEISKGADGSKKESSLIKTDNGTLETERTFDPTGKETGSVERKNETLDGSIESKTEKVLDSSGKAEIRKNLESSDGSLSIAIEASVDEGKVSVKADIVLDIAPGSEATLAVEKALELMESEIRKDVTEKEADASHSLKISSKDTGASLSAESFGKISELGMSAAFELDHGTVEFDSDAAKRLSGHKGSVSVSMAPVDFSGLPDALKGAVGDRPAFDISAGSSDSKVHDLGGKARITLPYELPSGVSASDIRVFYVDSEGAKHMMETVFDELTKKLSFVTPHFSLYVIGSVADVAESEDDGGEGTSVWVFVAAVAAIAIVAAAVVLLRRKG